jgi:hypothetical protein
MRVTSELTAGVFKRGAYGGFPGQFERPVRDLTTPAGGSPGAGQNLRRVFKCSPIRGISPIWVSEDQGLPIAHSREIALTKAFVLGGVR